MGAQFIGHNNIWSKALFLQQCAHQFQGGLLVPARLNQNFQNLSFIINSAPQIHPLAVD